MKTRIIVISLASFLYTKEGVRDTNIYKKKVLQSTENLPRSRKDDKSQKSENKLETGTSTLQVWKILYASYISIGECRTTPILRSP